jgi:SSS family solute:Na+ symporter
MAFWAVVFIYTMWGGLGGIASIDIVQASFFLLVFGASLFLLLQGDFASAPNAEILTLGEQLDSSTWVAWFLMPCLFMLIEQDMAQRCFSAKSPAVVKWAALGSAALVFLVSIVPITFGLLGKANNFVVPPGQSVFITLVKAMTSPELSAAVACAVMMAIISTAVSLIHSISSNLTQDFRLAAGGGKKQVAISKIATLSIGFAALFVSSYFENIVGVLIQSYELSVVCLFVPVLASLLKKQQSALPAAFAISFGAVTFVLFRIIDAPLPREVLEIAASALGFGLGYMASHLNNTAK